MTGACQVESNADQVLDMDQDPDRLWALELGVLRHAALTAASARVLRGRQATLSTVGWTSFKAATQDAVISLVPSRAARLCD